MLRNLLYVCKNQMSPLGMFIFPVNKLYVPGIVLYIGHPRWVRTILILAERLSQLGGIRREGGERESAVKQKNPRAVGGIIDSSVLCGILALRWSPPSYFSSFSLYQWSNTGFLLESSNKSFIVVFKWQMHIVELGQLECDAQKNRDKSGKLVFYCIKTIALKNR